MLSIVIPAYNEEEGIELFHDTLLIPEVKKLKTDYEIIYINDGSRDKTLAKLQKIARNNPLVRVINLSRNFGKELAITAGIFEAKGDATLLLDADGQHPPKLIKEFIKRWEKGAQVVVGVRSSNEKEGFIKKYGSSVFYKLFNAISDAKLVPRSTDFRLIDRSVRREFISCTERDRITRGIIDWLGFERDYVEFQAPARIAGTANYSIKQLFQLAMNSFISLSLKPLFFFGWVGLLITIVSLVFGMFIVIEQFVMGDPLGIHFSGSFMLGVFMSFMVGVVLMSQAMLAVYISHIHKQTQNRPLYVINEKGSVNLVGSAKESSR